VLGFLVGISYQSFEMANAIHDLQLLYEAKEHEATNQGLRSYECPCNYCHSARQQQRITTKKHLDITSRSLFSMAYGGMYFCYFWLL